MKKQPIYTFFVLLTLLLVSEVGFAACPVSGEELLNAPSNRETWCTMGCINEMLSYVEHHSRRSYDTHALVDGINTARTCAWEFSENNGYSVPYWNEFVDKTNYMLHQAGIIGSHTKRAVNADGTAHSGCELTANTPCPSRYLSYGKEVLKDYFSCMSAEDHKRIFTQLGCLYYVEGQMGSISMDTQGATDLLTFVQEGRSKYKNITGPYQQKIVDKLLNDIQNTVASCHPDLASAVKSKEDKAVELAEVVVIPGMKGNSKQLGSSIEQGLQAQMCKQAKGQEGEPNSTLGAVGGKGGSGNGEGCRYATGIVVCELPPDF